MKTQAHLNTTHELELLRAILIFAAPAAEEHRSQHDHRPVEPVRATVHDILPPRPDSMRPQIGAGTPFTREALQQLVSELAGAEGGHTFLPPNVLCADTTLLAWHAAPRRRPIHFSTADKAFNKAVSGREVPHPPLLFLAQPHRLSVLALERDERPGLDTRLCIAPYCNLYENGSMCTGTVKLPGAPLLADMPQWEEAFYDSHFTHSNLSQKMTSHAGGHNALWRELAESSEPFPSKYLLPSKRTLSALLG